jgi:hypothetical protein
VRVSIRRLVEYVLYNRFVFHTGPETPLADFKALMYDRVDVRSEFQYPQEGLLPVQGILSANEINNQNSMNLEGAVSAASSSVVPPPTRPSAR